MAGVPTEQELLHRYLPAYMQGQELPSGGAIRSDVDPYSCSPDNLPGTLFYTNCVQDQRNERRYVNGRSGYWMPVGRQLSVLDGRQFVGFKRTFKFCLRNKPRDIVTPWEMTEYTIHSSESVENQMAILAIRNSGP